MRSKLLEHSNLVRYTEDLKLEFLDADTSSSAPKSQSDPSASAARRGPSDWSEFQYLFLLLLLLNLVSFCVDSHIHPIAN